MNRFKDRKWVVFFAAFASVLWGSAFPVLKVTYVEMGIAPEDVYGKLLIAGVRFLLAGAMVFLYARRNLSGSLLLKNRRQYVQVALLGLVQTTVNYVFFYNGLANTTASKGAIINSLSNFLIIILAHFIYRNDRLNRNKALGILFGLAGVLIVNFDQGLATGFTLRGEGFMFISVATAILGTFMVKAYARSIHPILMSSYQLVIGAGVMLFFALGGNYAGLRLTPLSVVLVLYSALLSALAFSIWYTLLKYNKPGEITMFRFLIPVSGTLLGAVFLNEAVTLPVLVSLCFVILGIVLVHREPGRGGVS